MSNVLHERIRRLRHMNKLVSSSSIIVKDVMANCPGTYMGKLKALQEHLDTFKKNVDFELCDAGEAREGDQVTFPDYTGDCDQKAIVVSVIEAKGGIVYECGGGHLVWQKDVVNVTRKKDLVPARGGVEGL